MSIKYLFGFLILAPFFLLSISSTSQLDSKTSEDLIKNYDTIPKKELENKVTNLEKRALKIFPNPVKDLLIIGALNAKREAVNTVHIFNDLGELVYQNSSIVSLNNQIKINTERLKPGVYYLKVNKGSISKFIKI